MFRKARLAMGRIICVFIVGLVLIGLAGEVRGQENLDTLWTRTVGGAGTDAFYGMAQGNEGNILVAVNLREEGGHPSGEQVMLLSPEGDWLHSIPLSGIPNVSSAIDLRQTATGEIEILHTNRYYLISQSGELIIDRRIPGEFRIESGGSWPHYYSLLELTFNSFRFWSDSSIAINGTLHSVGYVPNRGYVESWYKQFSINYVSSNSTHSIANIGLDVIGVPFSNSCFVFSSRVFVDSQMTIGISRYCSLEGPYQEPVHDVWLPRNPRSFVVLADRHDLPWLAWIGRPFVAIHMLTENEDFISVGRTDSLAPNPVAFAVDTNDNLVSLSYATLSSPFRGIRFDVVGSGSGVIGETATVNSLPNVVPKSYFLLEDNTAFVVSTVQNGSDHDLLICRTDTIPTGYFAPQPASVELLIEGPPAWGYRLHSGSYSQNQIIFQNLCGEARGDMSGNASSRWESGLANFSVFFTTDHVVPTNSTSDTLWLTAPECESVDIAWSMNGVDGMVRGPFHPEVSLQTFSCQLEPFGVNARFDVAGATNMDSLQVWRKNATGTDSLLIGTKYAVAGHHVVGDHNVPVGMTWTYYLLAADRLGRLWSLQNASVSIFADPTVIVPEDYQLGLPYPNPFNASTTFSFDIPELSIVHLDIYDITGRLVTTLMDQSAPAGSYTKTFDASEFASGVYIYSFRANDFSKHGKVLLLK